ncbi:hypothetical protein F4782DRAFT_533022 [Xylaria castorea]|nr:hypothetical protein F4782DRAFT_533022 [Xylaria castorea]
MSSPRGASTAPRQLYFAYGSNLWMKQMAIRCPNSCYRGRALLPDYRWLINERGYANIVPASGFTIHGLVYELGTGDEARLDRSEGVSSGAYSKVCLPVILHPASAALQISTQRLAQDGGPGRVIAEARQQMMHVKNSEVYLWSSILVYVSYDFVHFGYPRDGYIDRMNSGIGDAVTMGVPQDYFENAIRNAIPERPVVRHVNHRGHPEPHATPQTYSLPKTRRSHSTGYLHASAKPEHEIDRRLYEHQTPRGASRMGFQYYL